MPDQPVVPVKSERDGQIAGNQRTLFGIADDCRDDFHIRVLAQMFVDCLNHQRRMLNILGIQKGEHLHGGATRRDIAGDCCVQLPACLGR